MADFRQPLSPTNDPNYLRQSKEPDRIKPLEQVSVPANTLSDTSFGALFQGIGNVIGEGLTLTDNVIKRNLLSDAHKAIDPIQAEHGSDMSPQDVVPIAGTGAKGKARLAAAARDNLFGTPEGAALPFGPQDATTAYAQLPGVISEGPRPAARPLPPAAENELQRVSRMNDAYLNGTLSDSYYNAQLVATTKELRARYPGYRDEVDAAVSQITGVQPANALRKSLLSDLNANANARAAGATDQEKEIQKQMPYISIFAPDFRENRAKYAGQEASLLAKGYVFQANDLSITAGTKAAGFDASAATTSFTDRANLSVKTALTAINSQVGEDGKTLNQRFNDLLNDPMSQKPENVAVVIGALERMKAQTQQDINNKGTTDLGNGKTYSSTIANPGTYKSIVETAVKPIDDMLTALKNGDLRTAKIVSDGLQLEINQEGQRILKASPFAKALAGLGVTGGKELSALVAQQPNSGVSQLMTTLLTSKAAETVTTPAGSSPPGIKAQADDLSKAGKVTGKTLNALVEQNFQGMNREALGSQANINFAKNLFDTRMLAGMPNANDRAAYVNRVASPETTHRVWELAKGDKQLWSQYSDFVKVAAVGAYKQAGDTVQSYITDKRFDVHYDDKAHQFAISMKPEFRGVDAVSMNTERAAQQAIVPLNRAIGQLTPIFEKNKQDVNQQVFGFINSVGVNPGAEKEHSLPDRLGTSIKEGWQGYSKWLESRGWHDGTPAPATPGKKPTVQMPAVQPLNFSGETDNSLASFISNPSREPGAPHTQRGVIKGNLSDETLVGIDTQTIPEGMSAREFLERYKKNPNMGTWNSK